MDPTSEKEVLSDRDPDDGGGRMSRGSNRPGPSRLSDKPAPLPPLSSDFPALPDRGITSMLRTEIEFGDLGDIVYGNLSVTSSGQYHTEWHGTSGSMSASSSMPNPFSRASKPFPGYSSSASVPRYPTIASGPQCGSPPVMRNLPSLSPPGMIENRDRDPSRSQSTTQTMQSLNNVPANRSHTNLRHAHNFRPHNSHTFLASYGGGPGSSTPNNRSNSSTLSDNIGLPSQASQNVERQRLSTGGYCHTYPSTGNPHSSRFQLNVGQGQPYRGPGQPHNLGQMRFRLPYQPSSRRIEDQYGEMEPFPPFDDTAYNERLNMTDKTANNLNIAAGPGQSKEDRMPSGSAGFLGDGSDAQIDELCGDGTPSEKHGNVLGCAVTSMSSGMKPSPPVTRATSDHAQKPPGEQSSKSCTSIPDESPGPARPGPGKDCEEYPVLIPNLLPQQGEYIMDPDAYSCSRSKGADRPDCVDMQSLAQSHPSGPETMGVRNTRIDFGVRSPRPAMVPKPLLQEPMHPTQDHFMCLSPDSCATYADTSFEDSLRNSQANTRERRSGRVAPGVGVDSRHAPRRSALGVGSHRNSLCPTRLTDIQEDSVQKDSTADLGLSRHRYPSPSQCLSDLKEKSHKGSGPRSVFVTPSSIQASGEDLDSFCRSSTVLRRRIDTDSNKCNTFTQLRGLPAAQPSQIGLSDELSGNVGLRHSRSVEQVLDVSQRLNRGSSTRPMAADEAQRQRISLTEMEEVERAALSMHPVATLGLSEMHRACSPELAAEMESLTVPLVGGLTQSLPESSSSSLKESRKGGGSTKSPVKEGVDRTHPTQERSSARLGSVPGMPHMVTKGAIHDELEMRGDKYSKEKEGDVSDCVDGSVAAIGASGADADEELETGNGTFLRQTPRSTAPPTNPQVESSTITCHRFNALHIQDPRYSSALPLYSSKSFHTQRNTAPPSNSQTALPAASRGRSCALHNQDSRSPSNSTLPPRRSSRLRTSTSKAGETRSCNPDTNCTSAVSTNTAADTFLPQSAAAGHPPYSRPPHVRNRLSEASNTAAFSTIQTVTASPSHPSTDSTARASVDHLNISSHINNQPHEAGDHYPSSALSPPTAIFSDQLCVSDTDDEIHDITHEARDPVCKRILRACDNAYYKLALRAGRAQPSPEWVGPSATEVTQDRASAASVEAESRHSKKWWRKRIHPIRQLAARKSSSSS